MQHSIATLALPVRYSRWQHALTTLALLALTACGGAGDTASTGSGETVNQLLSQPGADTAALVAATPARPAPTPEPAPAMPAALSPDGERPLLEAIARSYPFRKQIETKEQTGEVRAIEAARIEANLDRARLDLAGIKRNLASLSASGLPTYALIHSVAGNGSLNAWIVFPDGGVVAGATSVPYGGLGTLQGGLGVDRIAETRGPQLKGEEKQRLDAELDADFEAGIDAEIDADVDAERGAGKRDNSPEAIRKRREALAEAAAMLLPGDIRQVLAAGEGRLLVVPVRDTGTAPYAALPIRNQDDFAARRWSFVVMQDLDVLAGDSSGFDMGKVDLSKSVIVGDPDDMRDVRYSFPALPGARKEAQAIAKELGIAEQNVLIGADATRKNVVNAIDRSAGRGVIYMATHAVADAKNPLTRGFVVLSQKNLFAGELRTQQFRGWDEHQPLVVMSACQTALGRVFDGGTFGVARTWTNAGAGQVVASLWNVSDLATYRLMTRFVAGLQQGKSPELAMQAAQLETIKNYPNDPKMWASFTIIGKPTIGSGRGSTAAAQVTGREPAAE
jgi:CHAT domain